jgi:hypothetical protein
MEHIIDFEKQSQALSELFQKISERNTFLFLGAGSSVTQDKGFLASTLIDFYQDKKQIDLNVSDLTTFVDLIEAREDLSRDEFDEYVDVCLRRLNPTDSHMKLASIPWRQILTTNMDILIEQAYQKIENTPNECLKLRISRGKKELTYQCSNDEIKLIKLNGCISAKKDFPLVFSSSDFEANQIYYNLVLRELKNPSDNIRFLAIGYSFSDPWASKLFNVIDSTGFRDNRFLYLVDPNISDSILPLYKKKNICVIKTTFDDFIQKYKDWEDSNNKNYLKSKRINFYTSQNSEISLDPRILLRLSDNLIQLNSNTQHKKFVSKKDFYIGEEPNFQIINKHYDVIKKDKIKTVKKDILSILQKNNTKILPIIFLTGSFGTGKSTFAYRLIRNILQDSNFGKTAAFEIFDSAKLFIPDLSELFNSSRAETIILYFNSIEINYIFKSLLDFRNRLSIEQYNQFNILIITSIRENILEINQLDKVITNSFRINIDVPLTEVECLELVRNLKSCSLISYRDARKEKEIVNKIIKKYGSDSYISLMELVTHNHHIDDLLEAYKQLNELAQKAFLYTSLLFQYSIKMPSSLLKNLVSKDWQDFRKEVIEVEGKGILFQEIITSYSSDPDLYFKTKHPLISEKLINHILKPSEIYKHFQTIITHLNPGNSSSILATSLLKAIKVNNALSPVQINKLYDLAYINLNESHQYILHYSINLQHRNNLKDLEKAEKLLIYADSLVNERDSKLIHRRAVITFEIAKEWFKIEKTELVKTIRYLKESRELFEIKQLIDPCSSYSYYDFIKLELWALDNLVLDDEEKLLTRVNIEENFDVAERTVTDYKYRILTLENEYKQKYVFKDNEDEYLKYLDDCYDNPDLRPYALILLFNFYLSKNDFENCEEYLSELEYYKDIDDVMKLLFKYYGRNLNIMSNRLKFYELIREYPKIEDTFALRYNYFNFIASAYNKDFKSSYEYVNHINDKFNFLNPDFQLPWKETDSDNVELFYGIITLNRRRFKIIKIPRLNQTFNLIKKKNDYIIGKEYKANLYFYLNGIKADILSEVLKEENNSK